MSDTTKKLAFALLVAACLVIGPGFAYWHLTAMKSAHTPTANGTSAGLRIARTDPPQEELVDPPAQRETPTRSVAVFRRNDSMVQEFANSDNLKSIVDKARDHPELGSYFYAYQALRECDQLSTTLYSADVPPGSEGSIKRQAEIARLRMRCAGISESDIRKLRQLGTEGLHAGDIGFEANTPLSTEVSPFVDANRERVNLDKRINAVFNSTDAGVTEAALKELMISSDSITLNHRDLSVAERSSLPAALLMLSCDLGAPCGRDNDFVQLDCVGRGRCDFASVADYAEHSDPSQWLAFTRSSRYDYQTAVRLKDEIMDVIARGDRSGLVVGTRSGR